VPGGPSYWDYLRLDQLLALQSGLESEEREVSADELHFIIVHQTFELWFKLVLRQLRLARDQLATPLVPEEKVPAVVSNLGRVNTILRLAVQQFDVMETLTPQGFLDFRNKLVPASGFQSFQMREIELLLGLEAKDRIAAGLGDPLAAFRKGSAKGSPAGQLAQERVEAASRESSLKDALHGWLLRTPIHGSSPGQAGDDEAVGRFVESYLAAHAGHGADQVERFDASKVMPRARSERQQEDALASARAFLEAEDLPAAERPRRRRIRAALLFIESYRELPLLAWPRALIDAVVELEELLVLWRTRHARMVERVIGRRVGTGGSSGVDYLDRTAKVRIFDELWSVRTILLPRAVLPPVEEPGAYGFAR